MKDIIQVVSILLILMNRLHLRLEGNITDLIDTLYTDRFTVIWRLMVVDGLYFRGDKMAPLISIRNWTDYKDGFGNLTGARMMIIIASI